MFVRCITVVFVALGCVTALMAVEAFLKAREADPETVNGHMAFGFLFVTFAIYGFGQAWMCNLRNRQEAKG